MFHISPVHFMDQGTDQDRAGRPDRVAHGDCAPVPRLIRSIGTFVFSMKYRTTEANASLTSKRSMSDTVRPARSSALAVAAAGAVSMMQGSSAALAVDKIFAFGTKSELLGDTSVPDQHDGRAVCDAGRIAGVMNMTNLGNLWISQPEVIAKIFPDSLKSGR